MTDHGPTHNARPDSGSTYEEFELEDDRLVVYDANNPDAWLASEVRLDVRR